MTQDFEHVVLPGVGRSVHRLGLSASYRPGKETVHRALDAGLNFFFCYGFDTQMIRVLRDLPPETRANLVFATGAYNFHYWYPNLRRTLEKRLRQLRTDHIDIFLLLGLMGKEAYIERALAELHSLREEGKVVATGVSTHDRPLAGRLAAGGAVEVLMMRYNAAHRGAEQDIFPHLAQHNPIVMNHTATRWTYLLRRPRNWPKDGRIPTAGLCYRFVLSNPHIHVCLTAPRNVRQFTENLAAVRQGPLGQEEMQFMCEFGDAVHNMKKWFM